MNQDAENLIRFEYKVELLEDLHAGSGLGSVWVDRTLRRDGQGRPLIQASHVKGVWRDAMVRLVALEAEGFSEELLHRWFGSAPKPSDDSTESGPGRLHCPRLEPVDEEIESLVWMQAARERHSRRPADDTLRTTEYLPAGIHLRGEGYLQGSTSDFKKLGQLVGRVDRYGGNRSRGDGRIRCIRFEVLEHPTLKCPDQAQAGIRLLLRARSPVRVPRTGSPGNIIESDTRVPGRMLAGAIIAPLLRNGASAETLFSGSVAIGDALPLASDPPKIEAGKLSGLEVLPAPFEYRIVKKRPAAGPAFAHVPAWAVQQDTHDVTGWHDLLTARARSEQSDGSPQLKRMPDGTYLQREAGGRWQAHCQPLELTMRNRRGSDVPDALGQMEPELFSNEQIPAGTRFVADIRPLDEAAEWPEWLKNFKSFFQESPVLFIGRGRAPVEIEAVVALANEPGRTSSSPQPSDEQFRLTFTSDAIIRTEWLGFHQRLTLKALCDALDEKVPDGTSAEDVSEARIDRAFNAATRLPRPSVMALRAGSSIAVRGNGAKRLREKLSKRRALGERQHEGLGRFVLDLVIAAEETLQQQSGSTVTASSVPAALRSEEVARFARSTAEEYRKELSRPSPSQWGNLRASLDAFQLDTDAEKLELVRKQLAEAANRTQAAKPFEKLAQPGEFLDVLFRQLDSGWTIEDVRLALRLSLLIADKASIPGNLAAESSDFHEETDTNAG